MPDRTRHIALVSLPALFHPDFDPDKPNIRQFVEIPPGYVNSEFTLRQIEHAGMRWAVFEFFVWKEEIPA